MGLRWLTGVFCHHKARVVDANGLPARLGLIPGEARDNRLCSALLARLP
jgi:hypothetical protein